MSGEAQPPPRRASLRSKAEVVRAVRRTGVPPETIEALEAELPDPVDLDRDGDVLLAHGITTDELIDRLGGSP
jgi:hypothetical protein